MSYYCEADAIIIGAGIMGCMAAYEMAKRGISTIVLEKSFIGGGASGRSGGGVRQQRRHPAELPLAMESVKLWLELQDELDWDMEYKQGGNVHILTDPDTFETAVNQFEYSRAVGLEIDLLGPEETRKKLPFLSRNLDILGSTYCHTDGHANPLLVPKAVAEAAEKLGARFNEYEPVKNLKAEGGRVIAAVTDYAEYRAPVFINVAGAWARPLCNTVGLDFPLEIRKSQLMVTESLPPVFSEFISADSCGNYFRQAYSGGIHIGVAGIPIDDFDIRSDYTAFKSSGYSSMLLPFLKKVNVVHSWAGLTSWTPDAICIVDKAPSIDGLFLATGFCGHGFCLGPIVGRILAEWIIDGRPSLTPKGLSWTRFSGIYL
jgi:sarcosine oxidase subunit beta